MVDMPAHYPKFCMDMKQAMVDRGLRRDDLPVAANAHDALDDARWGMGALRHVLSAPRI